MSGTDLLVLRLVFLLVFFLVCLRLERRGRRVVVVLLLLGAVLVDATIYDGTAVSAQRSIFHPELFGQSFRLPQLLIPLALLARLTVNGLRPRLDVSAPFWAAFFAWVLVEALNGLVSGHPAQLVLAHASIIVNVGGAMLLAASVPAEDYVKDPAVPRFLQGAAVLATGLFFMDLLRIRLSNSSIPDLPVIGFGSFGADAATLFSAVGVLGLVLGLSRPAHLGPRALVLVPSALLILSHLASSQRAARLGLYVMLLVLFVICALPTGRRRIGFTLGQLGYVFACVVALGLATVFVPAVANVAAPQSVIATADADALAPRSRQGSIESRYNQWAVTIAQIKEKPLVGEGLGGDFVSYAEGKKTFVEEDISHNIVLDLLRRTGLVGFVLGLAALLAVFGQTLSVWRYHPDNQVAAFAAATMAVTSGLLAKGMVESIFEKNRLAVLLGCVLGMAISTWLSGVRRRDAATPLTNAGRLAGRT